MTRRRRIVAGACVVFAAVTTACAGDAQAPAGNVAPSPTVAASTTAGSAPTVMPTTTAPGVVSRVTDERGVDVVVDSTARIIPLDGDVAEIVFALGMGDRVVATDLSATFPPEADALPQIGYQRALAAEPILDFEPTVLIGTDIAGPPETIDDLEQIGVPVVIVPTDPTRDGPARKIIAVADALGIHDRGVELATEVQAEIDAAVESATALGPSPRVAVLYLRGSGTQLVLGRDYSTHWVVEAAGGSNIADELGVADSAPITGEAILAAAPDVVVVPEAGLASVGGVDGLFESIPALAETPAGRARAVLAYDDQLMLGNGPRTGEFLTTLISDLAATAEGAATP